MNYNNLSSFLTLGYFLDFQNPDLAIDVSDLPLLKKKFSSFDLEGLFIEAKKRWYSVFDSLYEKGDQLVPISGGLDSRAILATLLQYTSAENLSTYTFGTANTYDYIIGNKLAKVLGTKHTVFPFDQYCFSTMDEIGVSLRTGSQTFLFHHPPLKSLDVLYSNVFVWNGFMLDWIAGTHLPKSPARSLEEACLKVLKSDRFVKSINLLSMPFSDLKFDYKNVISPTFLSFEEQLEIHNRYPKYIGPNILYNGYNYKLPGSQKLLYDFFFSLPDKLRRNQTFYKYFLKTNFPYLFEFPIKCLDGLSLKDSQKKVYIRKMQSRIFSKVKRFSPNYVNPYMNYMDFNTGIRSRKDLNSVISQNLNDLRKREIVSWIDIPGIYEQHMNGKGNHSDALIVLSSLEIHLKAGKKI